MIAVNRLLATLFGLVLLVAGVVALVEIVVAGLERPAWIVPVSDWTAYLSGNAWSSGSIRAVLAALVVVGLLLLIFELRRRRVSAVELSSEQPGVQVSATRRSLQNLLTGVAQQQGGVDRAETRVSSRRARVTAWTALRETADVRERVQTACRERLESLGLARTLSTQVQVRRKAS